MGIFMKLLFCSLAVAQYNVDLIDAKNTTVLCYVWSTAAQRTNEWKFTVKDTNTKLCTHVVYAFMTIIETKSGIKIIDPSIDLGKGGKGMGQLKDLKGLKIYNPDIKVLASISAYGEGSVKFFELIRNCSERAIFINSLTKFIRDWELDGIDIYWQVTHLRADEKQHFVDLLKEIKKVFEPEGWILIALVIAESYKTDLDYDFKSISQIADFINLYAPHYHSLSDKKTGIHVPLKSNDGNNLMSMVDKMLKEGATASKILLGLPMYGRTYVGQDKIESGQYLGLSYNQTFTSEYNKICFDNKTNGGWTEEFDQDSFTPVAYNEQSLIEKAKLVKSRKLGGVMLLTLDLDYFRGLCHDESYPLLSAVAKFLNEEKNTSNDEN